MKMQLDILFRTRVILAQAAIILTVAITWAPLKSFGDIHEDQYNQLKSKQVAAITEVNRKYSEVLLPLLEKV